MSDIETERERHLEAAIREELVCLWSDLDQARRSAAVPLDPSDERRGWSICMLNVADRIGDLTRLVGPSNWEEVSVDLLLEGWWDVVHERAGIPAPWFDRARARAVRERRYDHAARLIPRTNA